MPENSAAAKVTANPAGPEAIWNSEPLAAPSWPWKIVLAFDYALFSTDWSLVSSRFATASLQVALPWHHSFYDFSSFDLDFYWNSYWIHAACSNHVWSICVLPMKYHWMLSTSCWSCRELAGPLEETRAHRGLSHFFKTSKKLSA